MSLAFKKSLSLSLLSMSLVACSPWQIYHKPAIDLPVTWQEGWRPATPQDSVPKGEWWLLFNDAELTRLSQAAIAHNQSLKAAFASVQQARALSRVSQAALYPSLDFAATASRTQPSANRPNNARNASVSANIQQNINPVFVAGYEVDLFGRIAHDIESAKTSLQQSQADFENLKLVLTADVASNYFNLRELESELDILKQSIELQTKAVKFAKTRHEDGVATGLDTIQQQALLSKTQAQLSLTQRQRDITLHALATLTGSTVNNFKVINGNLPTAIPEIPIGLPADALERRPDVAATERAVAIANIQIGVAKAAWYPSLRLSATRGWQSTTAANLFDAPSVVWSLGISLAQTIFDSGRNQAQIEFAKAGHELASAEYRQTVLNALQEVEDGLSTGRSLTDSLRDLQAAEAASAKAAEMIDDRYKGGIASVLELISARQVLLDNQRQLQVVRGQQLVNAVFLIKSLGGGWQNTLPVQNSQNDTKKTVKSVD
ncbi:MULTISPECIES: efflux transporter outer membrane subunit [Methylotenera]|uniref:efflux transporter outer membrane subunit n=1 Tax=Methylotenera TaxID=359407 RepID=UPI00039FFACB|nr:MULTISPECIES: efflux transporter outer membrane subunit [Methylotenera]